MNDLGLTWIEPDPTRVVNEADLTVCLKQLHVQADKPSCRALEARTVARGGTLPGTTLKRVTLRRNKVNQMLRGEIFPGKAFMLTFVEACGIDLSIHLEWRIAWEHVALMRERGPMHDEKARRATADVNAGSGSGETLNTRSSSGGESAAEPSPLPPATEDNSRDMLSFHRPVKDPSELATVAAIRAVTDPDAAEKLARSISEPRWRAAALTNIAGAVAFSDPARAERLAQSITEAGYRAFARTVVATTLAALDPDRAERLIQSFTDKAHKAILLAALAGTLAPRNPARAEQLAHSITDQGWKAAAIANIAGALTSWDPERARRLMADANEVAQAIADHRRKAWALDYIARAQQDPRY